MSFKRRRTIAKIATVLPPGNSHSQEEKKDAEYVLADQVKRQKIPFSAHQKLAVFESESGKGGKTAEKTGQ